MKRYRKDDDLSVPADNTDAYFQAQVRRPGLFFCLDKAEQWKEAENFVRDVVAELPRLKVLVYLSRGKWETRPESPYLLATDKRDFHLFLGKEKQALKQWISGQDFDLLLVFAHQPGKRCKKLALSLPAKLTAGWPPSETEEPWFDITLEKPKGEPRYSRFYKTLKKYFKQLNINLTS